MFQGAYAVQFRTNSEKVNKMEQLTQSDIDLIYLLVDSELQGVNEGWDLGSTGYANRLESILNKLVSD